MNEEEIKYPVKWRAPEFFYYHKEAAWYWWVGVTAAVIIIWSLFSKDILFALFTMIAVATLFFWAKRMPREMDFEINEKGVEIGTIKHIEFSEIKGFAIEEMDDRISELNLQTKSKINPLVKILLHSSEKEKISEALKKFVPEVEHNESFADSLSRFIGF